jgi:6-phosphogluconolactonase
MPATVNLRVLPNPEEVAEAGAGLVRDAARAAVERQGRFTVALSGGSTPRALYQLLATRPYREEIPWQATHVFWSDERCVPPDHPESNYRMAQEALLAHVPLPPEQVYRMPGELSNPQQGAQAYTTTLRAVFGKAALPRFDLLLLGLGEEGHTASLFPDIHVPNAPSVLVAAVYVPKVAMWRLTLTLPVLNAAAQVVFLVTGTAKQDALRALIDGPRSLDLPAQRVVPVNGGLTVLADQASAGTLSPGNP